MLNSHKQLRDKIERLESKYDMQFKAVFEAIKSLIDKSTKQHGTSKPIGFHVDI